MPTAPASLSAEVSLLPVSPAPAKNSLTGGKDPGTSENPSSFGDVLADVDGPQAETAEANSEAPAAPLPDANALAQAVQTVLFLPTRPENRVLPEVELTLEEKMAQATTIQSLGDSSEEEEQGGKGGEPMAQDLRLPQGRFFPGRAEHLPPALLRQSTVNAGPVLGVSPTEPRQGWEALGGPDRMGQPSTELMRGFTPVLTQPILPSHVKPEGGAVSSAPTGVLPMGAEAALALSVPWVTGVATAVVAQVAERNEAAPTAPQVPAATEEAEAGVTPLVGQVVPERTANSAASALAPVVERSSRVNPPSASKKETSLTIDEKIFAKSYGSLGMNAANEGEVSMSSSRSTTLVHDFRASEAVTAQQAAPAEGPREVAGLRAVQAVRAIEEVREVSEGLHAGRRHVELNFDFGNQDRLSVRLDLRQGEIHTQFRTDSTELRDALQQAWNSQGLSQEGRSRMAEPVFLPGQGRDAGQQQSFADAQNRQQKGQPSDTAPAFSMHSRRESAPVATPSHPVAPLVRSDRQLHVFA